MTTWIAIGGVALGSYALRFVPLAAHRRHAWPPVVERALRRAGLAALVALVVGGLQHHDGGSRPGATLFVVVAAVASFLVARRGAALAWVVTAGLLAYWLLTAASAVVR
jgi:branched-subunit amino acid transport protein